MGAVGLGVKSSISGEPVGKRIARVVSGSRGGGILSAMGLKLPKRRAAH